MASPGGKLSSEARQMRNAGGNVTIITLFQAYYKLIVHAIPHPSALTGCHLPPRGKALYGVSSVNLLPGRKISGKRKQLPRGLSCGSCFYSFFNIFRLILRRQAQRNRLRTQ